jgi:hypothetical protein
MHYFSSSKYTNKNGGYIALMATIIIALVLLVMIVKEGFSGWMTRFVVLGTEAKEQANALAEGCIDQAVASLITDPSYLGNTTSSMPGGDCKVFGIDPTDLAAGVVTVKTQAVVREAYANIQTLQQVENIHLGSIPTAPTYGTLIVQTIVSGQALPSNFPMQVSAASGANPASFNGSSAGIIVHIQTPNPSQPYPYTVTETPVPGYVASYSTQCVGSGSNGIKGGEIRSCTVSNAPVTTTLTLVANVKNDDGTGTLTPSDIDLYIDGTKVVLGRAYTQTAGTHTIAVTTPAGYFVAPSWGYHCSGSPSGAPVSLNLGDNKICVINLDDIPAPAPSCADTVMMLDRTGSMSSTDLSNERIAAQALVSLYAGVLPPATPPRLGVGSFGAYPNASLPSGAASVPANGVLTTAYNTLTTLIGQMLGSNSSVGTDLSAAINAGVAELNAHGQPDKEKVLVIVSDGDPSQPTSGAVASTGFFAPTGNAQNASGELWSNPTGAYADGGTAASDPVSENDRHRFFSFNFPTIPSNATITGIEVKADAWATTSTQVAGPTQNIQKAPSVSVSPNQWLTPSGAYASDSAYATSATINQQQAYGNFGFSIPSNAVITGIQVTTEAKVSGTGSTAQTGTLYPVGNGNYSQWTGSYSDVNEIGTPSCSSNNSVIESTNNDRESFNVDLSAVPNGATITSVDITSYDRPDSSAGGTYKTFVRMGATNTDAAATLTSASPGGSSSACNSGKTQNISLPATVKSASTALEIGVIKINTGGSTNNAVRVGALRAVVNYTNPVTGSMSVALAYNGSSYTTSKSFSLTSTESVSNSTSDLWGRSSWSPSEFNNGNFLLRVQNTSNTGTTVSLNQVQVQVFYTIPVMAPTACTFGVDLSWNGGSSWSSERTQTLTNAETTYTLGAQNDSWGSHTWQPGEFVNGSNKFLVRVRASNAGSNCDNASVENLDFLRTQVHYSVPTSPVEAALLAADAAKNSLVNVFTIYFGSGNPTLLAQLASGNTPNPNPAHNPGSFNDTNGVTSGNTGTVSPSANATDTGGTGNGFEGAPTGAYANGGTVATNASGIGDRHRYMGYNFNLPPGATINGIVVRADWWTNVMSGTSLGIELSWNGGTTWTTVKTQSSQSTSDTNNKTVGANNDTWGRTWSASDFSSANFRVRVTSNCTGSSTCSSRTFSLDWLPVTVYYTVNTENGDGDNFFIAPTSADMKGIFEFIGNQVCPAINNVAAANPPTTANLLIISRFAQLPDSATSVSVAVNATNPSATNANYTAPAASQSQTDFTFTKTITVDPGAYNVSQAAVPGYTPSRTDSCFSTNDPATYLVAGETRTCILTNTKIPPPPDAPPLTVTPGQWQEVPNTNP